MPNWETFLLLQTSVLLPLAMVALVLWPMFVAVIEIWKANRSPVTQKFRYFQQRCNNLEHIFSEGEEHIAICG